MDIPEYTSAIEWSGKFQWSLEKNQYLIQTRWISFYDMIEALSQGWLLSTELHSPEKYPHQKSLIIEYNWYVYSVPFVTSPSGIIFLKTIYPSRKYKKKFLIH